MPPEHHLNTSGTDADFGKRRPQVFSCDGCRYFKPDGWAFYSAHGAPIPEGPCYQYHFYNHEAARSACGGRLKRQEQ